MRFAHFLSLQLPKPPRLPWWGEIKPYTFFERRYRNNQGSLECQTFTPEQEIDQIRACKKLDIFWKNIFEDSQVWLWPLFLSLCQFRWFSKMHIMPGGNFLRPDCFQTLRVCIIVSNCRLELYDTPFDSPWCLLQVHINYITKNSPPNFFDEKSKKIDKKKMSSGF